MKSPSSLWVRCKSPGKNERFTFVSFARNSSSFSRTTPSTLSVSHGFVLFDLNVHSQSLLVVSSGDFQNLRQHHHTVIQKGSEVLSQLSGHVSKLLPHVRFVRLQANDSPNLDRIRVNGVCLLPYQAQSVSRMTQTSDDL